MSKLVTTSVTVPSSELGKTLKEHADTFSDIKRVSKPHDVDGEQWFYIDIYVEEPGEDKRIFTRIFTKYKEEGKVAYRFLTEILNLGDTNE